MPEVSLKPLPPAEAIGYFQQKGYRIGFDYRDVWQQEHQAAFTVAKAMHLDLLADLRAGVNGALANGTTIGDFKKQLQPLLQAKGWWGRKEVVDPVTGDTQLAQLGSPRRLQRIFDTNLATSYSEGQWERIQRNKGLFGFLEYVRSAAAHPRPSHLAYAGLVLPADDPFWQRHLPVKEWGCKCTVIQHTGYSLERGGLKVGQAPAEVMRAYVNPRTGESSLVPDGVDPAFNYPPGGRRANLGRLLMEKADTASAATAARVLRDGADTWAPLVQTEFSEFVGRYARGERSEVGSSRVAGALAPRLVDALQQAGAAPARATIGVDLDRLRQMLTGGARERLVSSLPQLLQHVGEAWLDGRQIVLLCTPADDIERVAKVVIDLGAASDGQPQVNAVRSVQLIAPNAFQRRGLRRLDAD
jgi:hypothetical protein